MLPFQLICC